MTCPYCKQPSNDSNIYPPPELFDQKKVRFTYSAEGVSLTESEYFLYRKLWSIEHKIDGLRWRR